MEKTDKYLLGLLTALLVIILPLIIMLTNFKFVLFDIDYYYNQFKQNNVYERIDNANQILDNMLLFFKDKAELKFFEKNEKAHLKDVKALINTIYIFYYLLLFTYIILIILLYLYFKRNFIKHIIKIFLYGNLLMLLLGLILVFASSYFTLMFDLFHHIFFPQGNYIFPANSLLINMFPEKFFYNSLSKIIYNSFILSFFFSVFMIFLWRRYKY
jgi:integral membrane protein (TIGR01906 family)